MLWKVSFTNFTSHNTRLAWSGGYGRLWAVKTGTGCRSLSNAVAFTVQRIGERSYPQFFLPDKFLGEVEPLVSPPSNIFFTRFQSPVAQHQAQKIVKIFTARDVQRPSPLGKTNSFTMYITFFSHYAVPQYYHLSHFCISSFVYFRYIQDIGIISAISFVFILLELFGLLIISTKGQQDYIKVITFNFELMAECGEKPISILETGPRISFFQSHVRDKNENFFLSISCFEMRTRISFFNLGHPDE